MYKIPAMEIHEKAEQFVFDLFKDKLSTSYTYHNFTHTLRVVTAVEKLLKDEKVEKDERKALLLAAWFHDIGYVEGNEKHEEKSILILAKFLQDNPVDSHVEQLAISLIRATEMRREPENILEFIIRDADSSHFGKKNYMEVSELLRNEWKLTQNKTFSDTEWASENINMLTLCHRFFTETAKRKWQPEKENNIALLQNKIKEIADLEAEAEAKISAKGKKSDKESRPERGIDTMFRVTLNNHTQLSQIADSKANILLSVNAIIISIALSTLIPKLDSPSNAHLVFPTFVMVMFSVTSIVFAILSTRPKVTSGSFTRQDVQQQKVNLLFFGNFHKMPLDEYQWAMNEMMKEKDYLYNTMIKDLYYLGLVLERKYKLLRITYNIFMVGIIVSVLVFVIAFKRA